MGTKRPVARKVRRAAKPGKVKAIMFGGVPVSFEEGARDIASDLRAMQSALGKLREWARAGGLAPPGKTHLGLTHKRGVDPERIARENIAELAERPVLELAAVVALGGMQRTRAQSKAMADALRVAAYALAFVVDTPVLREPPAKAFHRDDPESELILGTARESPRRGREGRQGARARGDGLRKAAAEALRVARAAVFR